MTEYTAFYLLLSLIAIVWAIGAIHTWIITELMVESLIKERPDLAIANKPLARVIIVFIWPFLTLGLLVSWMRKDDS